MPLLPINSEGPLMDGVFKTLFSGSDDDSRTAANNRAAAWIRECGPL
jgi:hypothetical protein